MTGISLPWGLDTGGGGGEEMKRMAEDLNDMTWSGTWWGKSPGGRMWWELEVNRVQEGRLDFTLKWQLTATERRIVFKFDSSEVIGSGRSWQNWLVKQREGTPIISSQCLEQKEKRERGKEKKWMNECIESLPEWTYSSFMTEVVHKLKQPRCLCLTNQCRSALQTPPFKFLSFEKYYDCTTFLSPVTILQELKPLLPPVEIQV